MLEEFHSPLLNQDLLRKFDKYTFIMRDAFDPTLNVARVIKKKSKEEKLTREIFVYTLNWLITNSDLPPKYVPPKKITEPGCSKNKHSLEKISND
jgi:hypothetical protein